MRCEILKAGPTVNNEELLTATAIDFWKISLGRLDKAFLSLDDAGLQKQIAPGKNRIYYLLGHMTAVHDRMLPLLGLGERLHPELDETFISNPDKALPDTFSGDALRAAWTEVHTKLTAAIEALPAADWLKRHDAVSEEDFAKEPLRNRLAVLLSRTGHVTFHTGQMRLIKS